jgi:hypothetical protein
MSSGNNNSTLQSIFTVVYSTVWKKKGPILSSPSMKPPSLPLNNGRGTAQEKKTVPKWRKSLGESFFTDDQALYEESNRVFYAAHAIFFRVFISIIAASNFSIFLVFFKSFFWRDPVP